MILQPCNKRHKWVEDMDRHQKQALVTELKEAFNGANTVVISHYKGLSVAEVTKLRRKAREAGVNFRVAKNSLAKLALQDTEFSALVDLMTGPTAIAYAEDVVAPAKTVVEFAKNNDKLVVIGGGMNETVLDASGVEALAKMPSLDELRGKIVGILNAPATRIAGILQAPGGQLARVMGAYAAKGE